MNKQRPITVMAHGTFDLLHSGHVAYLEYAHEQGDVLVVALASDEMTRFRKGSKRPIQPFAERKKIIESLRHVDKCIKALRPTDDLSLNLLETARMLRPQVLVSSYAEFKNVIGEELKALGIQLVIAPHFGGTTTTQIIDRILDRYDKTTA